MSATMSAVRRDRNWTKAVSVRLGCFERSSSSVLIALWNEAVSTLSCKPGLKIMCAAQLPRQVPGFHHSGGISKPLQVENCIVKLCKTQTACEPRVLGNSKGLSWMKAWQVFIVVHFYLWPWQHYLEDMGSLLYLEALQKTISPLPLLSRISPQINLNVSWAKRLLLSPKLEVLFSVQTWTITHQTSHIVTGPSYLHQYWK